MIHHLNNTQKTLLLQGLKQTGTMVEGFQTVEEQFTVEEGEQLLDFCKYTDEVVGGCSQYNITMIFKAWRNPHDPIARSEVERLASVFARIRETTKEKGNV